MKNSEIKKGSGNTIIITRNEKILCFRLNEKENKVTLETSDKQIYTYTIQEENGKLNVYHP